MTTSQPNQKEWHIRNAILILTIVIVSSNPLLSHGEEGPDIKGAITSIESESGLVEETRIFCNQVWPRNKMMTDYYAFSWKLENLSEIRSVEYLLGQNDQEFYQSEIRLIVNTEMMKVKQGADAVGNQVYCNNFVKRIKEGKRELAETFPKAKQRLANYIGKNPLPQQFLKDHIKKTDCLRAGFNAQKDYDYIQSFCNCLFINKVEYLDKPGRALMARAVQNPGTIKLPSRIRRVQEQLAQCHVKADSNFQPIPK